MTYVRRVNQLHDEAMEAADLAFHARRLKKNNESLAHFRRAFDLEREAALLIVEHTPPDDLKSVEPSRSVLLRSAATLALDVGEEREAEKLVALALLGEPSQKITEELHDVLEKVRSVRKQAALLP